MAATTAPFDLLHRRLDGDAAARSAPPWVRAELGAGGVAAWLGRGAALEPRRLEAVVGLEARLVAVPGYAHPGSSARSIGPGAWNRLSVRLAYGHDPAGDLDLAARFITRVALAGRDWRRIDAAADGLHGTEVLLALGTGFTYETRKLVEERDRLAAAHLAGGQLMLVALRGPVRLEWDTGVYGDFTMVQAHVFGPALPFEGRDAPSSALAQRGYYYGLGGTGEAQLRAERGPVRLDTGLRLHLVRSIDGFDRQEMDGAPGDPHGVADQRLIGRLALGARLGHGLLRAALVAEAAARRGAWQDQARTTGEVTLGVELGLSP